MGITLGWVALLLAGATGAAPTEKNTAAIAYTVRMVEAEGVGWRALVMSQLKPVTRQGAATVWTLPKSASKSLIREIAKSPVGVVLQAPRVIALSGVPASIHVRENRKFVTQVAFNSDESTPQGTPEDVRVGWHTTLIGRKLDQGILVKMVFEDTEVRGVYQVRLSRAPEAKRMNSGASISGSSDEQVKVAGMNAGARDRSPFDPTIEPFKGVDMSSIADPGASCSCTGDLATFVEMAADQARLENRLLELPEISSQEILGEWLIPKGECILVSFGPHTVADKSGKAVVRERLAFVEAEEQSGVAGAARSTTASRSYFIPPPPTPLVPPAPFGAVAGTGEPARVYVPNSPYGRPVDGVPPGSASPAPSANFIPMPVPSWRKDVEYFPSGPDFPWANTQNAAKRAQMKATGVEPAPPAVGTPTPVQPVGPGAKLPAPAAPSRSFPQGIHVDGSKAKLPPLPEDEMEDDAVDSESAEPRPSPQTKKPRKPQPASDESTTKASFAPPRSSTVFLPSVFLPGASVGFQFLLPVKPLSFRLPFNQRLEIEIFGRVVPDSRTPDGGK